MPAWLVRGLGVCSAMLLIASIVAWCVVDLPEVPLRVAPETTVVTALLPDGTPDFLTAHNERFHPDVPPENNLALVLLRVLGKSAIGGNNPDWPRVGRLPDFDPSTATGPYFTVPASLFTLLEHSTEGRVLTPWIASTRPDLAEWLIAEGARLDLLVQSTATKFSVPIHDVSGSTHSLDIYARTVVREPKRLAPCHEFALALAWRALGQERSEHERVTDLRALFRLGRALRQQPPSAHMLHFAQQIEGVTAQACTAWAAMGDQTEEARHAMREEIAQCISSTIPMTDTVSVFDAGDRMYWVMAVARPELFPVDKPSPDKSLTLELINRYFDESLEEVDGRARSPHLPGGYLAWSHARSSTAPPTGLLHALSGPFARRTEQAERYAARMVQASLNWAAAHECSVLVLEHLARLRLAETALSLRAWRDRTGSWPAELSQLGSVPIDPCTNRRDAPRRPPEYPYVRTSIPAPLRYRRLDGAASHAAFLASPAAPASSAVPSTAAAVLWSVGRDGKPSADDLVVPFYEP